MAKSLKTLSDLVPDDQNTNLGTDRGRAMVADSLRTYKAGRSVLVDKNGKIIAGNKTVEQAEAFGWNPDDVIIVPSDGSKLVVHQRTDLSLDDDVEARALAIADNRTSEAGLRWDTGVLSTLKSQTDLSRFFTPDEMAEWTPNELPTPGEGGDEFDPTPVDEGPTRTQVGDLWIIGRKHRLVVGDCTDPVVVERLMGGEQAEMIFTDPPYGVNYEGGLNEIKREKLAGDTSTDLYYKCMSITSTFCLNSAPWYIWFAGTVGKPVYNAVDRCGYTVRAMIIWNKINPHYGNFMAQYMQRHEPCLYCVKGTPPWHGPTNEVTVWDVKQPTVNEFHPTQKPIELPERAIRNSSKHGALVCDWFFGSGTTLIAAHRTGRRCYGIEISPRYADVILRRAEAESLTVERAERLETVA
jgi:DNA modification methylase